MIALVLASAVATGALASPARAVLPDDYSMRAVGDSVTGGFGYCGIRDTVCGEGPGQLMPVRSLLACATGALDGRCSANFGNPSGISNSVPWTTHVAHHHGISDFANVAVQGSTPADWDHGGELHQRLRDVVQANPRVVAMTLGANPILREFSRGRYLICSLALADSQLRGCVRRALAEYQTERHLASVYGQILANPRTHLVVSRYHFPAPNLAVAFRHKVDVIVSEINAAVARAYTTASTSSPGRVHLIEPDDSPWPLRHQCTVVQVATSAQWFFTFGRSGMNPAHSSTPWILANDFCTHPTAEGHRQFAHALGRVLPQGSRDRAGRGEPSERDDGTLELKLDYPPVQIGDEHPEIRVHLNRAASLAIEVRRDRCLERRATADGEEVACGGGNPGDTERLELDAKAGWHEVKLPVMEGYFTAVVDARTDDGQAASATAALVQRTRRHLMDDFEGTEIEERAARAAAG